MACACAGEAVVLLCGNVLEHREGRQDVEPFVRIEQWRRKRASEKACIWPGSVHTGIRIDSDISSEIRQLATKGTVRTADIEQAVAGIDVGPHLADSDSL